MGRARSPLRAAIANESFPVHPNGREGVTSPTRTITWRGINLVGRAILCPPGRGLAKAWLPSGFCKVGRCEARRAGTARPTGQAVKRPAKGTDTPSKPIFPSSKRFTQGKKTSQHPIRPKHDPVRPMTDPVRPITHPITPMTTCVAPLRRRIVLFVDIPVRFGGGIWFWGLDSWWYIYGADSVLAGARDSRLPLDRLTATLAARPAD